MSKALPSRAELEQQVLAARAELIEAEDHDDKVAAKIARKRCDDALEAWAQAKK